LLKNQDTYFGDIEESQNKELIMNGTFKTKFGQIRSLDERILISDNSKIQFFWIKVILVLNLISAILNLISHGNDNSIFFYIWISVSFISIFVFIALLRFTHKKELSNNEIKSIKYLKKFNNPILSFRLKNKKIRRVYLLEDQKTNNVFLAQLKTSFNFEV